MSRRVSGIRSKRQARFWFRTRILPYIPMFSPMETLESFIGFVDYYGLWPFPYEPINLYEEHVINRNAEVFQVLMCSMIRLLLSEDNYYLPFWGRAARFDALRMLNKYMLDFAGDFGVVLATSRPTEAVQDCNRIVTDTFTRGMMEFLRKYT